MANFSARTCVSDSTVIISATTSLTPGTIVSAYPIGGSDVPTNCFTILQETDVTEDYVYSSAYEYCLECFQQSSLGFSFYNCLGGSSLLINSNDLDFLPEVGKSYYICAQIDDVEVCGCYQFLGLVDPAPFDVLLSIDGPFIDCSNCDSGDDGFVLEPCDNQLPSITIDPNNSLGFNPIIGGTYYVCYQEDDYTFCNCYTYEGVQRPAPFVLLLATVTYDDCLACEGDNPGYKFSSCTGSTIIILNQNDFRGTPEIGKYYKLCVQKNDIQFCDCYQYIEQTAGGPFYYLTEQTGTFDDCKLCNDWPDIPRSANTQTTVCVYCCDCGASGETLTRVVPEHPVWTDAYGNAVTQLNMIVIGGNGLNG